MVAHGKAARVLTERQETAPSERPLIDFATPTERDAAWTMLEEAMRGGWRSIGPYGPRADLYDGR